MDRAALEAICYATSCRRPCELLQELLDEGNIPGAASVVRKLHEAAEVPIERVPLGGSNAAVWITVFSETLNDILEESIF